MQQLRFLSPWFFSHRWTLVLTLVLASTGVLLDHLSPWILKIILDEATSTTTPRWIVGAVGAVILSGIFGYWQRILIAKFGRKVESDLRIRLFQDLLNQPVAFFQGSTPGHLLQNLVQDLEKIQELTGPAVLHFFRTALTLVISSSLLLVLSPPLALWGFGFFCLLAWSSLFLMGKVYQGHRQIRESQGVLGGFVRDYLHGVQTVKASGSTAYFATKYEGISWELRCRTNRISMLTSLIWPIITLLCGVGIAGSIAWGYSLVAEGKLTTGALAAATLYLVRAQYPLVGLGIMAAMVQRGRASLDRIMEVRNRMQALSPQSSDLVAHSRPAEFAGMSWNNLNFDYGTPQSFALQGIHLNFQPGRSVGIVGDTGSGKSTFVKLFCGVLPVPSGACRVNEVDYAVLQREQPHGAWREWFAYAPQEGFLFSWTIRENIAFGAPEAEPAEIHEAAEISGLSQDLAQMESGIDSLLGEKGVNLSGGQKQRVGLARALIRSSPIVVLDDIFSALDPATEEQIIQALQQNRKKQSFLIVSHRYSAISHCDEILFFQGGRIVERGTHQSLLDLGGHYARNWSRQADRRVQ